MARARYDQRVLALVEVRGGQPDWEEAERRFDAHGWPVRAHHPSGEGPTRGVLEPDASCRVYEVEVRLFGAARGCERGALHRLRKVLRAARLEAYVRRVERLPGDREAVSQWKVLSTSHRPTAPGVRRRLGRRAERRGRYDTGALVSGGPRQALRLARVNADAGYVPDGSFAVRPLDGRWRRPGRHWPEEEGERRLHHMLACVLATASSLVFLPGREGGGFWFWTVVAVLGLAASLWTGGRLYRNDRGSGLGLTAVAVVMFAVMALGLPDGEGGYGLSRLQVFVISVGFAVAAGLWLLVRQWTWGEWVAWAVPLLATLALSSFLAAGSVLHAFYADGLALTPGDLDVPAVWQVAAALKLVALLSLVMLGPAWWGFARHRHHFYATPGDGSNIVLYLLFLVGLLISGAFLALDSAETAVARTVSAAKEGEDPPPYFGVQPEWTCVEPVNPDTPLSGEGARLDFGEPHLSFGVAEGNAVLWDAATGTPVKLPANKVRLVPAESATAKCARPRD